MAFGLIQFGFGFLVKVGVLVPLRELNSLFPKPNNTDQKATRSQTNHRPITIQLVATTNPTCHSPPSHWRPVEVQPWNTKCQCHKTPKPNNINAAKPRSTTAAMKKLLVELWQRHCGLSTHKSHHDRQAREKKICELSRIYIKITINRFQNLDQIFTKMPLPFYQNKKRDLKAPWGCSTKIVLHSDFENKILKLGIWKQLSKQEFFVWDPHFVFESRKLV